MSKDSGQEVEHKKLGSSRIVMFKGMWVRKGTEGKGRGSNIETPAKP
jgi:hypothetical protein